MRRRWWWELHGLTVLRGTVLAVLFGWEAAGRSGHSRCTIGELRLGFGPGGPPQCPGGCAHPYGFARLRCASAASLSAASST